MYLIRAMMKGGVDKDVFESAVATPHEIFNLMYIFEHSDSVKAFIIVDHEPEDFGFGKSENWKKIRKGCFTKEDYK